MVKKKSSKRKLKKNSKLKNNHGFSKRGGWKANVVIISVILFIVCLAFYPSLQNGFVNWDDDRNFYENPLIQNLNSSNFWENAAAIFQTTVIGNYNPIPIFTFAIEKLAFGFDQPYYWHLNNLILHCICVTLVFFLGRGMGLNALGSTLLALLFGIHPMRVESVAWITERKDVLYGAFYLAAMLLYIKYRKGKKNRNLYVAMYFLFVLSLLSKIQAVALPLSLICLDFYFGRRLRWKIVLEKIPLLIISLFFGILGVFALQHSGSLESNETYPVFVRPFVGSFSFMVYLIKSIVPYELVPLYPYPAKAPWYFYASILIVPLFLWVCYYAWKKQLKALLFGLAFFTVNIVFLLQILGAGQGFIADRFTYIPYFGIFFIYAYYFQQLVEKTAKYKYHFSSLAFFILAGYGYLTHEQSKIWENGETLWTHVLKHYNNITLPYGNRGNYYRDHGQRMKALADYSSLLDLKSDHAPAYNSRAKLYFDSSHPDTLRLALNDYQRAVELDPHNGEYLINRGAAYARLNFLDLALDDLDAGLRLEPDRESGYLNRSVVYNMLGNWSESIEDMDRYLNFQPNSANIYYQRSKANFRLGHLSDAENDLTKAILLEPNIGLYYKDRSIVNYQLGNLNQARKDAQTAIQLNETLDPNLLAELGI